MSVSARESGACLREEVQRVLVRSAKETTRVWFEQTVGNCGRWRGNDSESVSYTHLTLPTKRIV